MWRSGSTPRNREETFSALSPLVLVTGLVLTLQNPLAVDSAREAIGLVDWQGMAQSLDFRPKGPPPGLDADTAMNEEAEALPDHLYSMRDAPRGEDLRVRPQRVIAAE